MKFLQNIFGNLGKMQTMAYIAFFLTGLFFISTAIGIIKLYAMQSKLPPEVFERLLSARYSDVKEMFGYIIIFYFGRNLGRVEDQNPKNEASA